MTGSEPLDIYQRLGVRKRVNGAGLLTRLGGSLMAPEVLDAMREAAGAFVDMAELQSRASDAIARHTGAEAGIVTSGAAAAITLATAACLTRLDLARMERLPDTEGMPNEVIMFRAHRTGYDHAIRAAGARIVEVGFNDIAAGSGVRGLEGWEIEAAIGTKTVAIAYAANPTGQPSLAAVAAVAKKHDLPVIVDAAAQLPPRANLRRFIAEGASLVAYSGGKAIRGPQGTGILCGKKELVAAALIQQLDMDILIETWTRPAGLLDGYFKDRLPHHGLGRGCKVDKESIVGLLVALERFSAADEDEENSRHESQLETLDRLISKRGHVYPTLLGAAATRRYPMLEIRFDERALGFDAAEISRRLQRQPTPVHLGERRLREGILLVDASGLQPGDEKIIATALDAALKAQRSTN
jgi:D-glucosaminate-6-phosphate ammonia-lyase